MATVRRVSMQFESGDPFSAASREISARAEDAREHLRAEFDQFRAGIEELRAAESNGDVPVPPGSPREDVRATFHQLRAGINELRAEASNGDGPLFAISAGPDHARERVREDFEQLRAGIEKTLRALDDSSPSTG
jgi:hypothetical protein